MTVANDNGLFTGVVLAIRQLSTLAYAQGFTHWHYKGGLLRQARQSSFFLPAHSRMRTGDRIFVSAEDGFLDLGVALAGTSMGKAGDKPKPFLRIVVITQCLFDAADLAPPANFQERAR